VALDITLDAELELEGRVLDLIHHVNTLRKQQGYELTDRIVLTLPAGQADVLEHETGSSATRWRSASRPTPSNHRRFRRPELLALGELELSAQLDRQAERDVLTDVELVRFDVVDPPGAEPVDDPDDQPLGADAPDVIPTVSTPSSQASSISVSSSIRCDWTPFARATSTSRFEFELFLEPITSRRLTSGSISLTAHWRFEVA
jgi:hypothetical protein